MSAVGEWMMAGNCGLCGAPIWVNPAEATPQEPPPPTFSCDCFAPEEPTPGERRCECSACRFGRAAPDDRPRRTGTRGGAIVIDIRTGREVRPGGDAA